MTTDPTPEAVRALKAITAKHETPLSPDHEAAWAEWSKSIAKVDARTWTLLRAAFDAGAASASFLHGRRGGLSGGKARAAALSDKRKREIAKKAAEARWRK